MVRKIYLDSDIIINLLNKNEDIKRALESLDGEFFTTSINIFEIWQGRKNSENILEFISWLDILDLNMNSSMIAGDIHRKLRSSGKIIDLRDLFIGSICIDNKAELLTLNKKYFNRLKKFNLILAD